MGGIMYFLVCCLRALDSMDTETKGFSKVYNQCEEVVLEGKWR